MLKKSSEKSKIILSTLNSTYQHTSFGLRYILANMQELESQTELIEFTINQNVFEIIECLIAKNPAIIGFGVYIWNTQEILQIIKNIKKLRPNIKIILGGPEISFETESQEHLGYCDHVIKGEADYLFYSVSKDVLENTKFFPKIIQPQIPTIEDIKSPYYLYSDDDIKNRMVYVEASRGCAFKCEYCLSSLDKNVRNFDTDSFLKDMEILIQRGVREFKFVDRTFNLSVSTSTKILEFFIQHLDKNLFLHFEMIPDRLPEEIKNLIVKFPSGSLQFEVGIQTLNPEVSKLISRRQNIEKMKENFNYLKCNTHVHTHADLIVGLPGEDWNSFKQGFDFLSFMEPDEIQVGILKRLKGTPITRHTLDFQMIYSTTPPFQILQTKDIDFLEMQKLNRFAKYWDMVSNSGNWKAFTTTLKTQSRHLDLSFFDMFYELSEYLYSRHRSSHGIALIKLAESLYLFLLTKLNYSLEQSEEIIMADYCSDKKRDLPHFLKNSLKDDLLVNKKSKTSVTNMKMNKRQLNHL